ELDASGEEILQRLGALVGNVDRLESCAGPEHETRQVRGRADSRGGVVECPGMCFRVRDELLQRRDLERRMDHEHVGHFRDVRHGHQLFQWIAPKLLVERRIHGNGTDREDAHGIAIRRCTADDFGPEVAAGNLGTEVVCRAPPDGYTVGILSVGPVAVNPTLYKKLGCNPLEELVPVAHISEVPNVLVVHPSLKVATLEELVTYAKAHAGALNYASTGVGTSSHLSSFMLGSRAGFEAVHIPYKGAEALKDLLTGRIQF